MVYDNDQVETTRLCVDNAINSSIKPCWVKMVGRCRWNQRTAQRSTVLETFFRRMLIERVAVNDTCAGTANKQVWATVKLIKVRKLAAWTTKRKERKDLTERNGRDLNGQVRESSPLRCKIMSDIIRLFFFLRPEKMLHPQPFSLGQSTDDYRCYKIIRTIFIKCQTIFL